MLSSDKNVETLAQLIEQLKDYAGLQKEYVKLDVIEKVVRLLTAAALAVVLFLIGVAVMLFAAFGLASWLSGWMGWTAAFFLVAGLHLLLLLIVVAFRRAWIERPLVSFLANLLME
ncbi:MAG: phage holin family protein [Prevotella sp.]|nr:phage holin family protein [Prevotella sp.]